MPFAVLRKKEVYNELVLESLQNRRWYRKLSFLYKAITNQSPSYLLNVIPRNSTTRSTRGSNKIPLLGTKQFFSKIATFRQLLRNGINLT